VHPKTLILPAQPDDTQFLASLRSGGYQLEQTMLGYLEGSYSPRFAQGDRAVFVAWFETQRAGYVAGHRTTRFGCEGELQWLNVAEAFRGKGVADALIQRVLDWFLSNSIFKVCVNVDPDNIAGRKVYFRNGASELDSHWLIWLDLRKKQS
jgi:GNAT superfamily N-acetyltransferase